MNNQPKFLFCTSAVTGYTMILPTDLILAVHTHFANDHEHAMIHGVVEGEKVTYEVIEDVPEIFRRLNGDMVPFNPAYTRPKFAGKAVPA